MTDKVACRDYERDLKEAEKRIIMFENEISRKNEVIRRNELRFKELDKVMHHQSVTLAAYKDVTFRLEREIRKLEEKVIR